MHSLSIMDHPLSVIFIEIPGSLNGFLSPKVVIDVHMSRVVVPFVLIFDNKHISQKRVGIVFHSPGCPGVHHS